MGLRRHVVVAAGLALACVSVVSCASSSLSTTATSGPTATDSASRAPSRQITKVLTIVEENHSLSQMQAGMPYLYSLAQRFGYATNYKAISHPSLPNYLSIADGSSYGIADDNPPSSHPISGDSVFDQAITAWEDSQVV